MQHAHRSLTQLRGKLTLAKYDWLTFNQTISENIRPQMHTKWNGFNIDIWKIKCSRHNVSLIVVVVTLDSTTQFWHFKSEKCANKSVQEYYLKNVFVTWLGCLLPSWLWTCWNDLWVKSLCNFDLYDASYGAVFMSEDQLKKLLNMDVFLWFDISFFVLNFRVVSEIC